MTFFLVCELSTPLNGDYPVRRMVMSTAALHMSDLLVRTPLMTSGAM